MEDEAAVLEEVAAEAVLEEAAAEAEAMEVEEVVDRLNMEEEGTLKALRQVYFNIFGYQSKLCYVKSC